MIFFWNLPTFHNHLKTTIKLPTNTTTTHTNTTTTTPNLKSSNSASDLQTITSNILFRQKIWNEVGNTDGLIDSMSICKKWISQCEQLTRHFWRNLPDHPWRGSRVDFEDFEDYCEHLKKVSWEKTAVKYIFPNILNSRAYL